MLFNSLHFLFFFPFVTLLYFNAPQKYRWVLLFASSCYFYMAFIPKYIVFLFALIAIDYCAALALERTSGTKRKMVMGLSLLANLGLLGTFKYFNFLGANVQQAVAAIGLHWVAPRLDLVLPIGLSFHTFQSLAYTIEVYRGRFKAERHLGVYSVYVLFFPQLVAGPIERPENVLPQLHRRHDFDFDAAVTGLRWMLVGFAKKILVADNLAVWVDRVYNSPGQFTGLPLVLATVLFAFQIYCDFSGYSDIARGSAKVMGIDLMQNFDRPYLARSVSEFWKRWHISLSTWFRDYLYLPLGGNRVAPWQHYLNLFIVFLLSGLWHGAAWTFVIWGALHGFYLACGVALRRYIPGLVDRPAWWARAWGQAGTFFLVCFAWIFFRAGSTKDAFYVATHLFRGWAPSSLLSSMGMTGADLALCCILVLGLLLLESTPWPRVSLLRWEQVCLPLRWASYYALIFLIILLGRFEAKQFIYFQF